MNEPAVPEKNLANHPPPEIAISRWWRFAKLNAPLVTTSGMAVHIVFRGVWSHGLGPDFTGAMIELENRELLSGSVEIHRRASDWRNHGHGRDPAYNDVVLHVVLEDDGIPTRRADGKVVPVVILPITDDDLGRAGWQSSAWTSVGGDVCAQELASTQSAKIRDAIWELGDRRLASKTARIEARLSVEAPGGILYQELLDGLGYSANREPMRQLAAMVPLDAVTAVQSTVAAENRDALTLSIFLGAGGFLPMSPQLAEAASLSPVDLETIERLWLTHGGPWHGTRMPPSSWMVTRVRPANHPIKRIAAAALLLARMPGGIVFEFTEAARAGADLGKMLVNKSVWHGASLIGHGRAIEIVSNTVIPFAIAFAEYTGDTHLAEAASTSWERLAAGEHNAITRRAQHQVSGSVRVPGLGARGLQGLIHLDTTLCAPRRCFECPIAHLVTEDPANGSDSPAPNEREIGPQTG